MEKTCVLARRSGLFYHRRVNDRRLEANAVCFLQCLISLPLKSLLYLRQCKHALIYIAWFWIEKAVEENLQGL
jgi:hypothetical protein